jgi:hypothetical protein
MSIIRGGKKSETVQGGSWPVSRRKEIGISEMLIDIANDVPTLEYRR